MPPVLVVGSLHYDILVDADRLPRIGETLPGTRTSFKCGGKGGNQAVEAARHGATVAMIARVGDDHMGRSMVAHLEAAGVDVKDVRIASDASGMSVVISQSDGDYAAVIVSGANLLLDEAHVAQAAAGFSVGGVLILQNEIPEGVNVAAARLARQYGCRVILNAAPARTAHHALFENVDILVVNAVEAEMLGSAPVTDLASAARAARALTELAPAVIVTAGGDGVAAWDGIELTTLHPHRVALVSTHGAGDAFIGALAARLSDGALLREALTYANAAAAVLVATPDAARHEIRREQVDALLA